MGAHLAHQADPPRDGQLIQRTWYLGCLALGRLLRSGKYAKTRTLGEEVHKQRRFYAPFLISMGGPLMKLLDTGVRVLPQREWEKRERQVWPDVRVAGGTLIMPRLAGETLAALLERASVRQKAIELAAAALALLHRNGFTHGDAMAENVMVDLEGGVARWFDFETVHEAKRPVAWREADDLRALIATTLLRTTSECYSETLELILSSYTTGAPTRGAPTEPAPTRGAPTTGAPTSGAPTLLAEAFAARRPLSYYLGQAALPYRRYQEIGQLLARQS